MPEINDILSLITGAARQYPDHVALEDEDGLSLTYWQMLLEIDELRRVLFKAGVRHGSRIAIVLPNGGNFAIALLAVTCSAAAVPLNPEYRKPEYASYFDEIRITHLLVEQCGISPAREVARDRGVPILEFTKDRKLIVLGSAASASEPVPNELLGPSRDDIALILFTSGSTGRPKKVPLRHKNICVSVGDIGETLQLTPVDRCLCMWEQFHIGGLVDLLLAPLASGGRVICTPGFSVGGFFHLMASHDPTWFQGVPTTFYSLVVHARSNRVGPFERLRFIRSVASALSPTLMQELEEIFDVPVIQTFGMTEAAPLITTNPLPPDERKPGSVGKSCGPDMRIESPDGHALAIGEIGEVVVRGANVFSGYEDAPEANAKSFRGDWFRTGDTGYLDADGYLFLRGRLKEMINRGGEKITPQEVDDILLKHPAIAQAATFSVRHRTLGENVGAAIVLRPGLKLSEAEIRDHVAAHLASFKVPQKIMLLDKMPVDAVGKINRLVLAIMADAQGLSDAELRILSSAFTTRPSERKPDLQAMVVFHEDGGRMPVFWCFDKPETEGAALARYLPDAHSLFCLNSGRLQFPLFSEMAEKVAAFYAQQIMDAFAGTAVCIGGSGSGNEIALRISEVLADHGRPAARLCLVDHFDQKLWDFSGKLLLMFGKASNARAYRDIQLFNPGWARRFAHPPQVQFFRGSGENIFRSGRIKALADDLARFLDPLVEQPGRGTNSLPRSLRIIHGIPLLFAVYRALASDRFKPNRAET